MKDGWTYHRSIVGSKYTLQSTSQRPVVVLAPTCIRVVAESLVPVLSYRIGSQSVEDLVLVSATPLEPGVHFVHHHSLDLS